jgi:hypothetical protein
MKNTFFSLEAKKNIVCTIKIVIKMPLKSFFYYKEHFSRPLKELLGNLLRALLGPV